MKTEVIGLTLAAAAAVAFATAPVTSSVAFASAKKAPCEGVKNQNSSKGQGYLKIEAESKS